MSGKFIVKLRGGPFDGAAVPCPDPGSNWRLASPLAVEGQPLEDGQVASYRPSRERGVYSFRGLSRVVARLPVPGVKS